MKTTTMMTFLFLCTGLVGACDSDDGDATDEMESEAVGSSGMIDDEGSDGEGSGDAGDADEGSGDGGEGPSGEELLSCEDPDTMPFGELAGPGYDPAVGLIDPQDTYIVHTTQILVDPNEVEAFLADVDAIQQQLMQTPGLVAITTAQDPNCGYSRTLGVWRSEEAIYDFVYSGAHLTAIGNSTQYTLAGRTTHWEVSADEVPEITWDVAKAKIAEIEPLPGY